MTQREKRFTPGDFSNDADKFERIYGEEVAYIWKGKKILKSWRKSPLIDLNWKRKMTQETIMEFFNDNREGWYSTSDVAKGCGLLPKQVHRPMASLRKFGLLEYKIHGSNFF